MDRSKPGKRGQQARKRKSKQNGKAGATPAPASSDTLWCCDCRSSSAPAIAPDDLLAKFVWPMSVPEFMSTVYRKRTLVSHGSPARLQDMVRAFFHGGDVEALAEHTASDNIFVWLRSAGGQIESIKLDDATAAMSCHRAGSSLYFRAPPETEDAYVTAMSQDVGMAFAGVFPDGRNQGEIEVFASRAGHVTEWHFDFMENFTFQISGRKRWQLDRGGITHPLRGSTPHYAHAGNVEQQIKLHRQQDSSFAFDPPHPTYDEVVLEPGSLMYFPAGCWHRVICEEDSLSVNISLVGTCWADIVTSAYRQLLLQHPQFRATVCVQSWADAEARLEALLKQAPGIVSSLRARDVLPPAAMPPKGDVLDMTPLGAPEAEAAEAESAEELQDQPATFVRNPLAVLIADKDLPPAALARVWEDIDAAESDSEEGEEGEEGEEDESGSGHASDANSNADNSVDGGETAGDADGLGSHARARDRAFVIHVAFGGEDFESALRVCVRVPPALAPLLEFLQRETAPSVRSAVKACARGGGTDRQHLVHRALLALADHGLLRPELTAAAAAAAPEPAAAAAAAAAAVTAVGAGSKRGEKRKR